MRKTPIPIYLLTGFLGSGKTTLLKEFVNYFSQTEKKAALIMNELGEVNVDTVDLETTIPIMEMLGGCICSSISGDLKNTVIQIVEKYQPDVIIIESTGVALPDDTISGITEASFYVEVEMKLNITVIDAYFLMNMMENRKGNTQQMLLEQIRFGDILILNKIDKISQNETENLTDKIKIWNPSAYLLRTTHCKVSFDFLNESVFRMHKRSFTKISEKAAHNHVMAYTHYFHKSIERTVFEKFINSLPKDIYRAKGIIHFKDMNGPMIFQYAYQELEMVRMTAERELTNVAVFIGERFSKENLISKIENIN